MEGFIKLDIIKIELRYYWQVLSLFVDVRNLIKQIIIITILCIILAAGLQIYFPIILMFVYYFGTVVSILLLWKTEIKPLNEKLSKETELEEKYQFLFQRFTLGDE